MRFPTLCFVALASLLATAAASSYGNFSLSCSKLSLFHGFFLGASCCRPDEAGVESQSVNQLDLTMCIGMDQMSGRMQWEMYGKFSNYCTNCTLDEPDGAIGHHLTCICTPLVGRRGPMLSTLNLDDGISNDMGTLKCAGGMAKHISPGGY